MKFIRTLKANEDLNGYTLEETGKGDAYHIYKDNNTGKYRIYTKYGKLKNKNKIIIK